MRKDPIVWQRFEWTSGADTYTFEILQQGLFGTLTAPGPRVATLPMVAWEGLLECVKVSRKQQYQPQSRAIAAGMAARSGSRWTDAETEDLIEGFQAGRKIEELADHHGRSTYAVEKQLEKLGLMMRAGGEEAFPDGRFEEI